jgi:DNA-binding transcriptional ArsR family regulator
MPKPRSAPHLDAVMAAVSDPTRRSLFETALRQPGVTTSELCDQTRSISRWGVIKHLAVLRDAGLIQTMATGRLRRHYAERGALDPVRAWIDSL